MKELGRYKKITKHQLAFNFDGTGALESVQTVGELEFYSWLKDKRINLLSNNKEALRDKLKERYCYLSDEAIKISADEVVNNDDVVENEEESVKAKYNKLKILQSLPLEFKIRKAIQTLEAAADRYGIDNLILAYSGGRDSEVLSHLIAHVWKKRILHIFSNTTCEYPETLQRIQEKFKEEDIDIVMVSPDMSFSQVVKRYGFPMISKNISKSIRIYRRTKSEETAYRIKDYMERREKKWVNALECPFSEECCEKLKKMPMRRFQKVFGYECSIVGTLAAESRQRTKEWVETGCNAFNNSQPKCMPLATWLPEDIKEYCEKYNVKINKLYQMGYSRNGCMYCGYGCHLQGDGENRLKLLAKTHPHARGVFERNFAKYFDMMKDLGYDGFEY